MLKFLTRTGSVALIVLLAVLIVYLCSALLACAALENGESVNMGIFQYQKANVGLGRLTVGGVVYHIDIGAMERMFQSYKDALLKADIFTPELLRLYSPSFKQK